ncbi:electron transport complex subunit RsxE [Clostridium septicum]|uniref:Ion-translocating oxidoreductase complex subunit E n=1 Tax=Clostridium septicum TaxID=1504 RepID=A0A9N7JJY3_CLOSE|nr:electron transport complex subunit E [Clostridium septicum]AYE33187.1 electron transport complex subunit RsxE [Clostridium septicum]MDU1315116.1 electron transport complex subunit E [Clostridium septicum]QAS61357.1 electron transport complex subunit E [Clostridium septicum]UEC22211.1 electron transport complex subunit E [Clostridium septicum]USR99760.1 electron transport complex subunit E [Clostridium septicum]
MKDFRERLKNGIITENPIFVQVLAMCPTLAVTTNAKNALGMGLASTVVLIFSNMIISALRKLIPEKIRIPAYIVIIASFVTIVDMLMQGYVPSLYNSLGIFIPLIVVNCIILGRAESYASKNKVFPSIFDAIGMGLGFTVALFSIGTVREILGAGQILGYQILPEAFKPASIMILAPGAFFTLGALMTLLNFINIKKAEKTGEKAKTLEHNCGSCSGCGTGSCSKESIEIGKN